jgi:hypothetical protein
MRRAHASRVGGEYKNMKEGLRAVPLPAQASRSFKYGVQEVWRLLKQGVEFPMVPHSPLHNELRELSRPHMAVLVHKRAKISQTRGPLDDESWFGELSDFVGRMIWPYLAENPVLAGRSKNCVAEMLDEIVAHEQQRSVTAALADILPRTSRFDSCSWAS